MDQLASIYFTDNFQELPLPECKNGSLVAVEILDPLRIPNNIKRGAATHTIRPLVALITTSPSRSALKTTHQLNDVLN